MLEMHFDLMSDEELRIYLDTLFPLGVGRSDEDSGREGANTPVMSTPRPIGLGMLKPSSDGMDEDGDKSPLFPPSPPSRSPNIQGKADHPLRVLSRALRDLRSLVEELEEENEELRDELRMGRALKAGKHADNVSIFRLHKAHRQLSIHDNLTEALSTSLGLEATAQVPAVDEPSVSSSSDVLSLAPSRRPGSAKSPDSTLSARAPLVRASSSSTSDIVLSHSAPSQRPVAMSRQGSTPSQHSAAAKPSWTSGLWVWNRKPKRKGSHTSIKSTTSATPSNQIKDNWATQIPNLEEETEPWRKGDGGSPPSFRAIFLATVSGICVVPA